MPISSLNHALEASGKQLRAVFESLSEPMMDSKLHEGAMSPRESLEHLAECYIAYLAHTEGKAHDWGTYVAPDRSSGALKAECFGKREAAVKAAQSDGSEEVANAAMDYVALHDAYHVGQIASLRVAKDPGWNHMSLYE